jgi:hypothetical protein
MIVVALFTIGSAHAAMLSEGTKELTLSGGVDFDSAADTEVAVEVGYGYFIVDNLELGGVVGILDNDLVTLWEAGVLAEYNFDTGGSFIPYVGAGVLFAGSDPDQGDSNNGAVGQFSAGSKLFITEAFAIDASLDFRVASDDIFVENDGEIEDTEWRVTWGVRYFWE